MDPIEIRVHPMAAAYMTTLSNCIEAAEPMVRAGYNYWDCKDAIRAAAVEALNLNCIPGHTVDAFMCIVQTAFKILSKKERGSTNEM